MMTIAVLFLSLFATLLLGIPVAFSIGIATVATALVSGVDGMIIVQKMADGVNSFTLMALPLFILSGMLMTYGSTPRIMNLANLLMHKKNWGIGNAGIIGCAAFGTISGSTVATTAAIGSIVSPEMVKRGYPKGFTASIIAAAGTLGGIIPPSISFVVYAQVAGVSIKDMFMAGFIPGIFAAFVLCMYNRSVVKKNGWGAENRESDVTYYANMSRQEKLRIVLDAIPPLLMPVFVLGGVMFGIVTPTESATVAVVYALILGILYKELNLKTIIKVFTEAAESSATILVIISFSTSFGHLLNTQGIAAAIANSVINLSGSLFVVYALIFVVLIILGMFMELLTIIMITTPIFLPILMQFGVNPLAYGIAMHMALEVGNCTPPLAVCLFTSCKNLKIRVEDTFPDIIWVCLVMTAIAIVCTIFPSIATFLPSIT